ncbi:MAG: ATP-binding domain-containing protein, partial [Oscillospiraceae bacterium]|nr:ATP-binding domain-containing protein [Oscillospiraceae bacterium]
SIYRFRGATIENILSFEKQYSNAKVIRLEQNYRSTQTILDAANAVISNNEQRKGKNLWTANGRGDKIEFYTADDELGESRYVADTVVSNVANGENWNDHAILYRMNAQSNLIEQAFIRSGVPYRIIGGHRFYDRKEIRDAMAYLHVINNTADEIRLRRIINEPKRGIGETSMNAVFDIAAGLGISPFEVIKTADQYAKLSRAAAKLMSFAKMIEGFREKMEIMPLGDLLGVVLDESGYMLSLANEPESYQDRAANLSELANNIRRYNEENPEGDLNGFLQETALLTDIDNYNAQAETVIMMTIHSAKGLEFPNVFIVGMEEGIFPGMQTILYEPENIEEERRLAYVAITRAKRRLYISCARTRMLYGNTSRNAPSRFVREIPDELLERRGTSMFSYQQSEPSSSHAERPFGGSSRGGASRVSGTIEQKASRGFSAASGFSGVSAKPAAKAKETYSIGETVEHKAYGKGVIISQQAMANDTMLEIAFEKVGTKKIMANYAKLKKL